jgi:hypothetical protein
VSTTSIFVCRDPRGSHWQLGSQPPESGSMTLIGWRQVPDPTDSELPQGVRVVLARALTSVARVTFPSSLTGASPGAAWTAHGNDQVREVTASGLGEHVRSTLKGRPKKLVLVSTRQPTTVMTVFEDAEYPWWLQGQILMLSAADANPPDVDLETLLALFEDGWTRHAPATSARGLDAVMRPGVDGDLAGLLSFSVASERRLLNALEAESRGGKLDWAIVDESTFADRYAQ